MTSPRQHAANQTNALKSTGPRTESGKTHAAQNAVRHGLRGQFHLIAGEEPAQYDAFRDYLHRQLRPIGTLEDALAERVIEAFWRLRRIARIQAEMMDGFIEDAQRQEQYNSLLNGISVISSGPPPANPLGIDLGLQMTPPASQSESKPPKVSLGKAIKRQMQNSDVIGKFQRYEAHIERGLFRALPELQRLQAPRQGPAVPVPALLDITGHFQPDKQEPDRAVRQSAHKYFSLKDLRNCPPVMTVNTY